MWESQIRALGCLFLFSRGRSRDAKRAKPRVTQDGVSEERKELRRGSRAACRDQAVWACSQCRGHMFQEHGMQGDPWGATVEAQVRDDCGWDEGGGGRDGEEWTEMGELRS